MKFKKELIFIIIGIILLGIILFVSYKFLNKKESSSSNITTNTSNTSTEVKKDNEIVVNGDTVELNLNDSYTITESGNYKLSGKIENGLITINTDDNVKLILNGITITNNSGPCIYVENAKNVVIELSDGTTNTLTDGKSYSNQDIDACIYSKDDLFIQGSGTLVVNANYNDGIVSKDDLTITSGNITVTSVDDAIKGKDSVTIDGGKININSKGDGIKTTNEEDTLKGIITLNGGDINIKCSKDGFDSTNKIIINNINLTIESDDDGIHADGYLEINNGTINITAAEGLEATYIKINDGTVNISASDDGINCANKSNNYSIICEINGGNLTIKMGQGDTDGIDSNGNLYINGGIINITGQSAFDYDGEAKYTGGKMIINGEETTSITNQFMGGGQGGSMMDGNMSQKGNRGQRR